MYGADVERTGDWDHLDLPAVPDLDNRASIRVGYDQTRELIIINAYWRVRKLPLRFSGLLSNLFV